MLVGRQVAARLSAEWRPALVEGLPRVFTGGWVGYCGYDTVRYVYSGAGYPHSLLSVATSAGPAIRDRALAFALMSLQARSSCPSAPGVLLLGIFLWQRAG